MEKPKILCVDDEPFILSSLARLLRTDYEVISTESGKAALETLNTVPGIGIALVDQRMPEMSGVELLEKMTIGFPDVVKIVLTGYTDMGALVDSVNKGEIFRYIQKPWDSAVLKSAIASACSRYNNNAQNRQLHMSLQATEEKLKKVMDELQMIKTKI
jgi:response regulator RpfG family c-di-GMP phosphodiesterase